MTNFILSNLPWFWLIMLVVFVVIEAFTMSLTTIWAALSSLPLIFIAKTGLPPFMLGLNWSTSERMAQQQTDMFTSELWHYRRILTPVIKRICSMFLRMNGFDPCCEVEWDEISLLDETEQARAAYYNAQAEKYRAEALNTGKEK